MASIFDTPPPPVFTRDGRDGFPPERDFEALMAEYIEGLNPRKRDKALMTQAMYDTILIILTNPHDTRYATAQFRFWTKKMFRLVTTSHAHIVTHENRPVAVKEQIYDVLVQCHSQCSHGGRDKTSNQVRRYYSWIPKELIARFVKSCPLCNARRSAKSGGNNAGLAALTALGADTSLLLAANGGMIDDSSPPSESSTSSDSAVTTPSRQMRPLGMPNSHGMPFTPGSYLASAMYSHQMPMSASSMTSSLPPMPSPSHNPQDWTQWVNNTPQRVALSQSVVSNGSATHDGSAPGSANPTLHFTYHTSDTMQSDGMGNIQSVSLQTPPQARTQGSDSTRYIQDQQPQQQHITMHNVADNTSATFNNPTAPTPETQAYYSQLMHQTMASFLQAPPMISQWSSDSVTTVSSGTSASSRSSVELEDLTDSAANSPLPPLPSDTNKDPASIALQQQIDSITAHFGGVTAQSVEDDEEASFQSFMSSFQHPQQQVEQDQIDPLLRAMNLDVMQGMPPLGEAIPAILPVDPPSTNGDDSTKPSRTAVKEPATKSKKASASPLGGNTFKFPPAPVKTDAKKNDKKNDKKASKSSVRNAGKSKISSKESKSTADSTAAKQGQQVDLTSSGKQQNTSAAATTPVLSPYLQLQNTFNQMREGLMSGGNTPALDNNATYMDHQGQQAHSATQWQGNGSEKLSESNPSSAHAEFSFHVSDMSGDGGNTTTDNSFNIEASQTSTLTRATDDGKIRPRPPQLDFSSFSNINAFSPAEYVSSEQDLHMPNSNENAYLTTYQYPNDFNQSTSGSVSAPAHITQFTQPEVPIITPNAPLFNYEQQMQINYGFSGNSFADYGGMDMGQYGLPSATTPDLHYDYSGNNTGNQPLQLQAQDSLRPASAGGYLEANAYGSPQKTMAQQQQQHMSLMPAIHSAPFYHLPMSSQQQQAQARELSEQIQAILDSAVPTSEALVEQASGICHSRPTRKR